MASFMMARYARELHEKVTHLEESEISGDEGDSKRNTISKKKKAAWIVLRL